MSGDNPGSDFDATRTSIGAATLLKKDRLLADRYRIVGPIGVGGMGLVYRAHDERLKLDVALKILRPERAPDKEMLERFERELVLSREVSHPNVLRIHDIGQDSNLHFITMDLVEGRSLRDVIEDEGPLDDSRAATIAAEVAEGLDAAHRKGVVHRDLKPGNILLDQSGQAYVSDFGVARSLHAANLTSTGIIVGSPDYLAPEQARGEPVDGRTDIYALGLIIYEMLTGELPFRSGTLEELIAQRSVGQPRDLAKTGAKVPAWLRRIVYRCLNKDPAQRYQTAAELADDLRTHNAPRLRLPRFRRRHLGMVAGLLLVLSMAAGYSLWVQQRDAVPDVIRVAVLPLSNETGNTDLEWLAAGFSDMLDTQFAESPTINVIETSRVNDTLEDLRLDPGGLDDRMLGQLAELLGADRILGGAVRQVGGTLRIDARLTRGGGQTVGPVAAEIQADSSPVKLVEDIAASISKALSVTPSVEDAVVLSSSPVALEAYIEGRAALRRADTTQAIPLLETAVQADPGFGIAWLHLADSYNLAGYSDRAAQAVLRAIEQAGNDRSRVALQARALQAALTGDYETSRTLLAQLIERFPSDTAARMALAQAYGDEGRFDEASEILHIVVANDPNHPRAWFLLGKYAIQSGDSRRAISEYLVRDLVIQNRLGNAQGRANVLNAMGIAYTRMGQVDRARENYEQAAKLRRDIGDQRGMATSLNNLASLEMVAGNFDAARASLDEAKQVSRELGDQAGLAAFINTSGTLEEEAGNYPAALAEYRDALKIREELGDRRALTESYNNVGFAYYVLGELDNARIYWERALDEARELGNRDAEMQVQQSLGLLYTARADWDIAQKSFIDALAIGRELDYPEAEAVSLGYLGYIAGVQGRYDAALSQLDEAMEILERVGDTRGLSEFGLRRATLLQQLQLHTRFEDQLERVENLLRGAPNLDLQAEYLRLKALTRRRSPEEIDAILANATDVATRSGNVAVLAQVQLTVADNLQERGDHAAAVRLADAIAQRARRAGYSMLELEALGIAAQSLFTLDDAAATMSAVRRMIELLDHHAPLAVAYQLRTLATDILAETGDEAGALKQQRKAVAEISRVRDNLPRMALDEFNTQPLVMRLNDEALVDGN